MMAIPADDYSPEISDLKAFSYFGPGVKVPDLVSSGLVSRVATALMVQGSRTLVGRKAIRFFMVVFCLLVSVIHSHADLGWTLDQFKQQYGNPVLDQQLIAGRIGYVFTGEDYIIAAFFRDTQVSRILYICRGGSVFDWGRARALLMTNAPDASWGDASKNEADKSLRVDGTKDGVESYYASLTDDGQMLAIWTKEDDEAGRAKPGPEAPPTPSFVDSNEKSSNEVTAEHLPSPDTALPAEIKHSDAPEKLSSSAPASQSASAPTSRTKIAKIKVRSPKANRQNFHVAHFEARTRSTRSSHQTAVGHPAVPTPTPLLMNAGTALYNSDYTQPFKDSKRAAGP